MKGLRNLLLNEQFRLERVIKETKARLEKAPEGRLRLSKSHNHTQYYCCTEEKKSGEYISKENEALAQQLAQKSYDYKILQLAEKRLSQIKKLLRDYADYFYRNGIEYKYECPLYLKGLGTIYPDFTFLSKKKTS